MTEAIAFDTHKFVKHMTAVGFTEQQAEALANEQVNLLNSNLATKVDIAEIKADIAELKAETKADIAELKAETKTSIAEIKATTKTDIAELKADLFKWMIGALIAQIGVIVTLIKLL